MSEETPSKASAAPPWKIALMVVLVFVFAFVFLNAVLPKKKKGAEPPSGPSAEAALAHGNYLAFVNDFRINDKQLEEQAARWDLEWGRDPFAPPAALSAIVKAVNLTLKAVLWDEQLPKAIVNEKTLLVGDMIYGYKVVQIKPRSVILQTGEKNIELHVFSPIFSESGAAV